MWGPASKGKGPGREIMPSVPLVDVASRSWGERVLSEAVFGVKPNPHVVYEAVRQYRAGRRRGTHATKNRALVSGSGRKPWRQKGTGRARVGSIRSPLWRKGGTVFGPVPRNYAYQIPGKVQREALRSALSLRAGEGAITLVTEFPLETPSTKRFRAMLEELSARGVLAAAQGAADASGSGRRTEKARTLIVDMSPSRELRLSARNLPDVEVRSVQGLNAYLVLAAGKIFLSEAAASHLEESLAP